MSAKRSKARARARRVRRARDGERGYALLLAIFIAAVMIIAATAAVPNLITQNRRQKEKLLIWRGEQYARAIGLYYRKTGHYPHDLKELAKGVNGVHFLRQPYKDPINTRDGSWRLIYLGPGGQLIGSLRWHTLAEYQAAQLGMKLPGTAGPGTPAGGKESKQKTTGPTGPPAQGASSFSQPHTQIINEGQMMGGNLIGVASKVKAKSLKVYMGGKKYIDWEFIWNPLQGKEAGAAGAAPQTGKKTPESGPAKKTPTGDQPPNPAPPQPKEPQQPQP